MISSPVHSLLDSSAQGLGGNSGSKASPGANKLSPPIGYDPGRTLAHVLLELRTAQEELARLDRLIAGNDPTPDEDDRWSYLEDAIWLRRDEAKAMIEAATGVRWEDIEGASL